MGQALVFGFLVTLGCIAAIWMYRLLVLTPVQAGIMTAKERAVMQSMERCREKMSELREFVALCDRRRTEWRTLKSKEQRLALFSREYIVALDAANTRGRRVAKDLQEAIHQTHALYSALETARRQTGLGRPSRPFTEDCSLWAQAMEPLKNGAGKFDAIAYCERAITFDQQSESSTPQPGAVAHLLTQSVTVGTTNAPLSSSSQSTPRASRESRRADLRKMASMFVQASLSGPGVPDRWSSQEKVALAAYIFGTVDALAQGLGFDQDATAAVYVGLCRTHIHDDEVVEIAAIASSREDCAPIVQIGGEACINWYVREKALAPLALAKVLLAIRSNGDDGGGLAAPPK